jgi:transcriptional regulator with XRE-family HTH domain
MAELKKHWTENSVDDFVYRIASDFVLQLETKIEKGEVSQRELAVRLNVSDGRVSQVLNNPGNLTLKKVVEYARALGMKVAIVAYDDGDSENNKGPINPEIFNKCWKRAGSPADFFALSTPFVLTPPLADLHYYRSSWGNSRITKRAKSEPDKYIISRVLSEGTAGTNTTQVLPLFMNEEESVHYA